MSVFRVATAYAKSVITLAQEQKQLDKVYIDMEFTASVCSQCKDFAKLLQSPVIPSHKKLAIIKEVFSSKVNKLTLEFFILISKKSRENLLPFIATEFINEYKKINGIQQATIVTAMPLDENSKKSITNLVASDSKNKVEFTYKVDQNLIGGFILSSDGKQVDASVRNKLNTIKNQFNSNPYISKY
jgi:F-type H+-transporting ATPase subunit delta